MGNLHLVEYYAWTEDDYKVSETMQKFFVNFIKKGNPNGIMLPKWPAATANDPNPPVMNIDVKSKLMNAEEDARYEFLDEAYGNKSE